MMVIHKVFGPGQIKVIKVEGGKHYVEVQFSGGRRKLEWELCLEQGFLIVK